jgi:hypothetical protein
MNLRIPVPRPVEKAEGDPPPRGGVDDEDLRKIEQRAERYISEQATQADAVLARREDHERAGLSQQLDSIEARAIAARAQTLKAEGNTTFIISVAAGAVGALVFGPFLLGGKKK